MAIVNKQITSQPDYSEWAHGPELITKQWTREPSRRFNPHQRPYQWHKHLRGQLLCIESGLIQVRTEKGTWVLPPHRAGWIPPDAMHSVHFCSALRGWSLLLTPDVCEALPASPCVIGISDVLRALTQRSKRWDKAEPLAVEHRRMLSVIVDEIRLTPHESLHLPMPQDSRLQKVTQALLDDPGNQRTVEEWAALGSVSSRTLRRLMRAETGLSFAKWQQQAKLNCALEMLARGVSVGDVSDKLGYSTPSNFIAMFRKAFGDSPKQYLMSR